MLKKEDSSKRCFIVSFFIETIVKSHLERIIKIDHILRFSFSRRYIYDKSK